MALARQYQRPQSLRQMFGVDDEVGQVPSGIAFNDYLASIPPTYEQQREGGILSDMDARTNASMADDLATNNKVRDARNMGFEGTHPLREQADFNANQELEKLLAPRRLEVEAQEANLAATREFNASQRDQDRELRRDIAQGTQSGQNERLVERSAAAAANQVKPGKNPLRKLFGGYFGIDTNEDVQRAEQAKVRDSVRQQMTSAGPMGGGKMMVSPDGSEQVMVPADRVDEYLAKGARIVE